MKRLRPRMPPPSEPPAEEAPRPGSGRQARQRADAAAWIVALAVMCLAIAVGYRAIWGFDIGFYLSMGRWIARHLALPANDPLTFTLTEHPLVDMYWLYELGVWGLYRAAGSAGLLLGNIAVTIAAMGLAATRCVRRGGSLLPAALLQIPFAFGNLWEIRPHVMSWLYLNMLLLAMESLSRRERSLRWAVPILMAFWANTHPLFALGLAVLAAYALPEVLRGRAADRRIVGAALAGAAACLFTPYGLKGLLVPVTQFHNLQAGSVFKSTFGILEYRSPWDLTPYRLFGPALAYHPLLHMHMWFLLALAAVPFFWRNSTWAERLVFALTLAAFSGAQKNFGYFFFAALPLVANGWGAAGARVPLPPGIRPAAAAAAAVLCVVVCLHVGSGYFIHGQQKTDVRGSGFNPHKLPVRAADFLNRGDVPDGRMFNALHDGGYIGFATERRVFLDGRLELGGPTWYRQHVATMHPDRLGETLLRHEIQFAVVPFGDVPIWFQAFAAQEAWRCVYLDDYSAVFFRADFAPSIPALSRTAPGRVPPLPDATEERRILARGVAIQNPGFVASLRNRHYYPLPETRLCRAYMELGMAEAAVAVGLEGLRRTTFDAPGLLLNLGSAYWMLGCAERAAICYRAWLAPRPGHRPNPAQVAFVLSRLRMGIPGCPAQGSRPIPESRPGATRAGPSVPAKPKSHAKAIVP